jgi:hypothetical protein
MASITIQTAKIQKINNMEKRKRGGVGEKQKKPAIPAGSPLVMEGIDVYGWSASATL